MNRHYFKTLSIVSVALFLSISIKAGSYLAFCQDSKDADSARSIEIEKAVFLASANQDRVLRIALVDCIFYALKNNSEILVKQIDPKLRDDDLKAARAEFEPTFNAEFSLHDDTERASSLLQGATTSHSRDIDFNTGVSGKLTPGTTYSLDVLTERYYSDSQFETINPAYSTEPRITITQPIFRGFGVLINKADILVAQNNKTQSKKLFKNTVMDVISKTKIAYNNYIFYLKNYEINGLSLERLRSLLEINKARYEKGLVSSLDILEIEAQEAQREKALLAAEAEAKRAEDELKLITNLVDDPELWNAKIELIDKPEFISENVDLLKSLENAFNFRPDYQSARIDLENRDIKIKVAQNALLPTLDLTGSLGLNGLGKDYEEALSKTTFDYPDWSLGVKFSLPWGGAERAQFDQAKLEKLQALINFKRLEQNIILDVRDKVREADIKYRQVKVAQLSQEKETQNYQAQKERYAAGQVSTHDMLDYQDKLSQAELDYVRALVDYNITLINLDKTQGVTLVNNDIKLEE